MFKNLRPLFPYLRKYRATFVIGALCVLCQQRRVDSLPAGHPHAPSTTCN